MEICLKDLLYIIGAIVVLGGYVVTFFSMQTKQNMKIERCEQRLDICEHKLSEQSHYQIKTEKEIVRIFEKLDTILEAIQELKDRRKKVQT